jgi:hypothetical protein
MHIPLHVSACIGYHQKFRQHYREILYVYTVHFLCIGIFTIKNLRLDLDIMQLNQVFVKINVLISFQMVTISSCVAWNL